MQYLPSRFSPGAVCIEAALFARAEMTLKDWAVIEAQLPSSPCRTRHFVGVSPRGAGYVSGPIFSIDVKRQAARTALGHVLQLEGVSCVNVCGMQAVQDWLERTGARDVEDVSDKCFI